MGTLDSWDVTDANNNAAPPDGWPENTMNYSDVNNTGRAVQGTIKRFFADINGSLNAGGLADAYTLTLNEAGYAAYFDGMMFSCTIPIVNATVSPTINVNGIGPASIVSRDNMPIGIGELHAGGVYDFRHDGTNVRVIGGQGVAGNTTEFQFNNAGEQAGSPGFTYNTANDVAIAVNPFNVLNDIVITEQAARTSTPAAGFGYLWVRNDSPSALIFTSDTGVDVQLGVNGTALPGGVDTTIQFNNSSAFGGDSTFTFNATSKLVSCTHINATTLYNSDTRISADGFPVSRWFSPFGSTYGTVFARNIELNLTALERGRTGDGVCAILFDTDANDGVMYLGVEPDGVAAGTVITDSTFTAMIEINANNFGEFIAFHIDDTGGAQQQICRVDVSGIGFTNGLTDPVGISFPSTPNPSTDANTLDAYEEGIHTTGFITGGGSVTINTTNDSLAYTKIGRVVFVTGLISVSSVSAPTGTLQISLPFDIANLTESAENQRTAVWITGMATNPAGFYPLEAVGASRASIFDIDGTDLAAEMQAATQIRMSFHYFTDE